MKKQVKTLSVDNFTFLFHSQNRCTVTFYSTLTNKDWSATTNNIQLINEIRNSKNPKQKDLLILKNLCKDGNN